METSNETVYMHELICINCGAEVGEVRSKGARPPLLFRARQAVCTRCGGWPILSGEFRRILPREVVVDYWAKRGRPPNWLRELRMQRLQELIG